MGVAAWLVWRQGGWAQQAMPLLLYAGLLLAAWLSWPPTFCRGQTLQGLLDALGEPITMRMPAPTVQYILLFHNARLDAEKSLLAAAVELRPCRLAQLDYVELSGVWCWGQC